VIPLKSLITFLILAWVINFLALQDAARSSPMMDEPRSRFSTNVKPASVDFLRLKTEFTHKHLLMERLEVLAQQILIDSGFHISRNV